MTRTPSKRGRPKTARPRIDLGTPELQLKRLAAVGPSRPGWPAPDIAAAESALGVLLWQGFLHGDYAQAKRMHDAGVTFCGWWVLVHPKTFTQGTLGRFQPGGSTVIDAETAEANLKAACTFLARDRAQLDAVINTCVYQRMNLKRIDRLRGGLCRLLEWLKRARDNPAKKA